MLIAELLETADSLARIDADVRQDRYDFTDHNPASLIALAAYELRREAFAQKVAKILFEADYDVADYDSRAMSPGTYAIHFGVEVPHYAQPYDLGLRTRALHVTVQSRNPEDAKRIRLALIGANLLDGWSGNDDDFDGGFSCHGWVSVR